MYFKNPRSTTKLPFETNAFSGKRKFKSEEDIWNELIWFYTKKYPQIQKERKGEIEKAEKKGKTAKPISLGQELWIGQFCDSKYIVEDWMFDLIEEVNLSISADIPIAKNVQECPAIIADYYAIIKEEFTFIEAF